MTPSIVPVKVGVIGVGNMGWHHARILSLLKDAELIGVPYRVTIGPKGIADGVIEFAPRASGESTPIPIEDTPSYIAEIIQSAK